MLVKNFAKSLLIWLKWNMFKLIKFTYKFWGLFLAHLSRRLKWSCHSAPSVVRPLSSVNFDPSSATAERNSTKLGDLTISYQVNILGRSEKQDDSPGLWFSKIFSISPLNMLNRIQRTWQERKSQRPPSILCFSDRSENQQGRLGLRLAETLYTSFLKQISHTSAASFHFALSSVIDWRIDMHKVWYVLRKVEWNSVGTDIVSTKYNVLQYYHMENHMVLPALFAYPICLYVYQIHFHLQ